MERHPPVVQVVDRQQLLLCEDVIERDVQLHILHIRCDGVQFRQQFLPVSLRQMAGIGKEGVDESVGRDLQRPALRSLQVTLFLRLIGHPCHILLSGDGIDFYRRI